MKILFFTLACALFIACQNPSGNPTGQNPPPPEQTYYDKEVSNIQLVPTGLYGGYEITMSWENPADANFAGVRIYNLEVDPENPWLHGVQGADKTSVLWAALPEGSTHTFLVKCVDKNGKLSKGITTKQVFVQPTDEVGIFSPDLYGSVLAYGSKTLTAADFTGASFYNSFTTVAYEAKTLTFTYDKLNDEIIFTGLFEAEGRSDHRKMELFCDKSTGLLKQKGTITNLENGNVQAVSKVTQNKAGSFITLKGYCVFGLSLTVEPEETYDKARAFDFYRK